MDARPLEGGGGRARSSRDLAALWARLARANAFPGDPSAAQGVERIQTHLSHVYLTAQRVYKFRKRVDLGFVRFVSLAERTADCVREVELNRRLAPDVYLGLAPLVGSPAYPRVGPLVQSPEAAAREHCVVMRRLPEGRDALSLLEAGELDAEKLDLLAARIARFHAAHALGVPAPFSRETWLARCTQPAAECLQQLAAAGRDLAPPDMLALARDRMHAFAAQHADRFERRRCEGRAVDAHGDLHLQHVWYEREGEEPIAIDCLEFSDELRKIDVAAEVAFLAMDLTYRGAAGLAERFLRSYARESDDFDLYSVVDYFIAYRAAVRAKVAAIAAGDPAIDPAQRAAAQGSACRHLELASAALVPSTRPVLVLVGGMVGTGKSSVAAELADRLDGVVIASDRVRKRLAGVAPTARVGGAWQSGAYTAEHSDRTYAGLLERAQPVLASGRVAILDATFGRRARREAAVQLAGKLGVPVKFVEVRCAADLVRERLARRAAAGTDPSDAGPEHQAASARDFERTVEWPEHRRAVIHTDVQNWRSSLPGFAAWVRCLSH
jgi:aminoglycoside phosphotransferase family enzyme/predicted kinase